MRGTCRSKVRLQHQVVGRHCECRIYTTSLSRNAVLCCNLPHCFRFCHWRRMCCYSGEGGREGCQTNNKPVRTVSRVQVSSVMQRANVVGCIPCLSFAEKKLATSGKRGTAGKLDSTYQIPATSPALVQTKTSQRSGVNQMSSCSISRLSGSAIVMT